MDDLIKKIPRRFREPEAETRRIQTLLTLERRLWERGDKLVAGVDEAGRGPLAGPVVAAAVIFKPGIAIPGIDDSKKLTARQRDCLAQVIRDQAVAIGVGVVSAEIIDEINILRATHRAMREALEALDCPVDHVLIDGRDVPNLPWPNTALTGGDAKVYSIAAASIVAKVERDRMMQAFDELYPVYGFAGHKGYGAASHIEAIRQHGPCPIHRRSFGWGQHT